MTTSTLSSGLSSSRAQPARLERLRQIAVLPERYTERPPALRALQRIDSVEITTTRQREGSSQKVFVLDLCFKLSRRRIPVVSSRTICSRPTAVPASPARVPSDTQVERSFSEIRRLSDAVYYAASKNHGLAPCAYCNAIYDFILLRTTTPSATMQWLQSEESQCVSLTQFVQQLVRLAVQVKASSDNEQCCGQQRIPELISEFLQLLTPEDEPCV